MANCIVVGAGTMGLPLIQRLAFEGHHISAIVTRKKPKFDGPLWIQAPLDGSVPSRELDAVIDDVDTVFLAVPSDGVGDVELAYMMYALDNEAYVITFAKSALAYHYEELRPHLQYVGRSATVGGRTLILPWMKSQRLVGKTFTMYGVFNASSNFFMDDMCSTGSSPEESYLSTKNNHLAEPGSSDYVGFLNGELGGDIPQKVTILMKDTILPAGIELTPRSFKYLKLKPEDVADFALPTKNYRYVVCISNTHRTPLFDLNKPGHLYATADGFTISAGFHDVSGNTQLNNWLKGGKTNGVQIRFEGRYSVDGIVEIGGPGAGLGTVGAAMNDMYDFLDGGLTLGDAIRQLPYRPETLPKIQLHGSRQPYRNNDLLGALGPGGE